MTASKVKYLGVIALIAAPLWARTGKRETIEFKTSDRCVACHNELKTASGADVSIGFEWRASIMANSARDPYWQGSVRRETIDHPESQAIVEDDCSNCHMPIPRFQAKIADKLNSVLSRLPLSRHDQKALDASDGVDCSVCHQISAQGLGKRETFNGNFNVDPPTNPSERPEYGQYKIERGQARIMNSSTKNFRPVENTDHIQKSELCASCHTLYTKALGPGGKVVGELPEQMPYFEWLNSDFRTTETCQDCHMTKVTEPAPITRVFGVQRDNVKRHVFVGSNFFMQRMLNQYRDDLDVVALPQELSHAADNTANFLQTQAAIVTIQNVTTGGDRIEADVLVENKSGHKLPTAYPSRRAWLKFAVRDRNDRIVFESGALLPDGSIAGNDNDADPARFEPHYSRITSPDQVEIFEDILADQNGKVTTGLLQGVRYIKDNRILPKGFNKATENKDIAVIGEAATDDGFTGGSSRIRYSVPTNNAQGPFRIEAELMYQPIGYRWANNLKPYNAPEPKRFSGYYDSTSKDSALVLAHAALTR